VAAALRKGGRTNKQRLSLLSSVPARSASIHYNLCPVRAKAFTISSWASIKSWRTFLLEFHYKMNTAYNGQQHCWNKWIILVSAEYSAYLNFGDTFAKLDSHLMCTDLFINVFTFTITGYTSYPFDIHFIRASHGNSSAFRIFSDIFLFFFHFT